MVFYDVLIHEHWLVYILYAFISCQLGLETRWIAEKTVQQIITLYYLHNIHATDN